jgi:NAD(P)-dependent dehydrogenase (short-subunit alcohol dehydrogenase family)
MARCLAYEFAPEKIRVNCISPGLTRSFSSGPLWQDEKVLAPIVAAIPLRRIGEPEDIAATVVFLSADGGSYVTGATLLVDGGQVALANPSLTAGSVVDTMAGSKFN